MGNWVFTITETVKKFLNHLSEGERTKIKSIFLLFEEYGPSLPSKYIKRISGTEDLWELRVKRIRIFFFIKGNAGIGVHGIMKKSQKTPQQEIITANKRVRLLKEDLHEDKID